MIDLGLLAQYLANGLVIGSSYVLVAVGLTLIFGILGVVNFAHGEFYMIGGYAGIVAIAIYHMPILVAVAVVLGTAVVVGFRGEAVLNKPLRGRDTVNSIIS